MNASSTRLGPTLEIRDVAEVRARLLADLEGNDVMQIDVGSVTTADTAGVQLLLALRIEARHRGTRVEIVGESPALNRAMLILGLGPAFQGWIDAVR